MRTATTPTRRWLRRVVAGGALAGVLAVVIVGSGIAAAKAKPVNNTAPKIFGAAKVGQVQTGDRGDWTNVNSYAYAWLRCNANGNGCNPISGATGTQYTLTASDDGHRIRFRVTATNGDGSTVAPSAATAVVVASGKPANTARAGHLRHAAGGLDAERQQRDLDELSVEVRLRLVAVRQQGRLVRDDQRGEQEHVRDRLGRRQQHRPLPCDRVELGR